MNSTTNTEAVSNTISFDADSDKGEKPALGPWHNRTAILAHDIPWFKLRGHRSIQEPARAFVLGNRRGYEICYWVMLTTSQRRPCQFWVFNTSTQLSSSHFSFSQSMLHFRKQTTALRFFRVTFSRRLCCVKRACKDAVFNNERSPL